MGATRPASGKCNVYTLNKGSQTAPITRLSVSLCLNAPRAAPNASSNGGDASRVGIIKRKDTNYTK